MGREIRRVPEGWEHPRGITGYFMPLSDQTYEDALADWLKEREEWLADEAIRKEAAGTYNCHTFEDWHGEAPDPAYYRPAFNGTAICYQVYETVSEGTPVSPVFPDTDSLIAWLVNQGHSRHAAEMFVEKEWAPSMAVTPRGITMNIDVFDDPELFTAAEVEAGPIEEGDKNDYRACNG